jgi:Protein of unknown function (DUF3040)
VEKETSVLDDDGVVLTQHEHEVLAALASSMDDGWLAHQLAGGDPPPPPAPALPRWLGPALLVLGMFTLIAAFMSRWWVGVVALVLMGLGTWLAYGKADSVPRDLEPPAGTEHLRGRL